MTSDTTTFFLAFTFVFAGIAWLLWRIERQATALEARLAALRAERAAADATMDDASTGSGGTP